MNTPGGNVSPDTALEMIDVSVGALRDPSVVVLEGVNWTVNRGDYWAVGGLLRSGKSDLMSLAAGLTLPVKGDIRVDGRPLVAGYEDDRLAARLQVGLVFDGGQLIHHLTLAENIALPLLYHSQPDDPDPTSRIEALIELTGLEPWAGKHPPQVSRNWQQRIGLARALAMRPRILLLDSPLGGMDPRDADWWLDLLGKLSSGHPIMDDTPMTLIVTGDDLRPWSERARQFALVGNRGFVPLGNRPHLAGHTEPLLRDLLRGSSSRGAAKDD